MYKQILTATVLSTIIGSSVLAQENQHYAEIIADCSSMGIAERNAASSDPEPLSELQKAPGYSQMVSGMLQALDSLDAAKDKEGLIHLIEKMLSGIPDGDIPLHCFRIAQELRELSQ